MPFGAKRASLNSRQEMLDRIQELNHQIRLREGERFHRGVRELIDSLQAAPRYPARTDIVLTVEEAPRLYADLTKRTLRKARVPEDRQPDYSGWPAAPYTIRETHADHVRKLPRQRLFKFKKSAMQSRSERTGQQRAEREREWRETLQRMEDRSFQQYQDLCDAYDQRRREQEYVDKMKKQREKAEIREIKKQERKERRYKII